MTMRSAALEQEPARHESSKSDDLIGAPALRDPNPLAQSDRRTVRDADRTGRGVHGNRPAVRELQVNVTIHLTDVEKLKQ